MKIITVLGARPQFIKAAVLSRLLKNSQITETIIHTGQHYDDNMSKRFFDEMDIPTPHYNLQINNASHGAMTGRMLEQIEKIIIKESPDLTVVYGDTNSTLAGALSSAKLNIPVAHIEAGLRSFNMKMPEEINRILTDRVSSILFCPTDIAVKNLRKEGFDCFDCKVKKVGDVMQDAAYYYAKKSETKSSILNELNLDAGKFIICTIHRQESTNNVEKLIEIIKAIEEINKHLRVVVPLHPRTKVILNENNILPKFETIPPVGYFDIIQLLKNCRMVITDSGGLQKEAFFFKKMCLTLREETEWMELVDGGYNFLGGHSFNNIMRNYEKCLNSTPSFTENYYGNGSAGSNIMKNLVALS